MESISRCCYAQYHVIFRLIPLHKNFFVVLNSSKFFASCSGLGAFESEGIQNITALKEQLVSSNHEQSDSILKRHTDVITRWQKLINNSAERKNRLLVMQVSI